MPFIGGGGVEKNLYIIANHLSAKFKKIKICTLSRDKLLNFNKKIKYLGPSKNFYEKLHIRLKSATFRQELSYQKTELIKQLNDSVGKEIITDVILK